MKTEFLLVRREMSQLTLSFYGFVLFSLIKKSDLTTRCFPAVEAVLKVLIKYSSCLKERSYKERKSNKWLRKSENFRISHLFRQEFSAIRLNSSPKVNQCSIITIHHQIYSRPHVSFKHSEYDTFDSNSDDIYMNFFQITIERLKLSKKKA